MEENFPALGAGPAAAPKGAWGAGDTAAKLQKLSVQGAWLSTPMMPHVIITRISLGVRLMSPVRCVRVPGP